MQIADAVRIAETIDIDVKSRRTIEELCATCGSREQDYVTIARLKEQTHTSELTWRGEQQQRREKKDNLKSARAGPNICWAFALSPPGKTLYTRPSDR